MLLFFCLLFCCYFEVGRGFEIGQGTHFPVFSFHFVKKSQNRPGDDIVSKKPNLQTFSILQGLEFCSATDFTAAGPLFQEARPGVEWRFWATLACWVNENLRELI
ncbi:hypothetical protein MCOR25_008005 [Pyricularia grisea]|uniref:Secreted protein n=1 Tax=Pyricularia grisea TaxID=148305 RepID=A0A6P8AZG5_PYRGI|nr:hypothetical protein PgNI_10556 [Pyricularia grisea]KAI6356005.1 hypothetical protein MCOR25_008005 [Pyricularia grisea]TLD07783.1 hypothetical protein PgNI_10556 [Pyricularia grisea]